MPRLEEIHRETPAVYERNARGWDEHRPRSLPEQPWLDRWLGRMAPGSAVLDVGCGAGEPISRYVIEKGFDLTGVDASPTMIEICQARFPDHSWVVMDMRALDMGTRFAGIIAWDSFFHLNPDEQRHVLRRFVAHLDPPGALLLTIGHESGEVLGTVEGEAVYHSSLAPREYERILGACGFGHVEVMLQDQRCEGRTVLMAAHAVESRYR